MDAPHPPRVEGSGPKDLNQLGEFNGAVLSTQEFKALDQCVVKVYADRLEIPELSLSLNYESVNDIVGGTHQELGENEIAVPVDGNRIILVRYKKGSEVGKLALSWRSEGIDSLDYCEIMLYRAFAVHKIRAKNNGAPCYGIVGY